jgi:hypothetical protein
MLAAAFKDVRKQENPFSKLGGLLASVRPSVTKNAADFDALLLSVRSLDTLFWRESEIRKRTVSGPLGAEAAHTLIREIAERDQALLTSFNKDWESGRSPKSLARVGPLYGMEPKDQLVYQWQRAAEYSAALAQQPQRFYELLPTSPPG